MNNTNHMDRSRLPNVGNYVRVKVPETIFPGQEFFVVVPDAGRERQGLKSFIKLATKTLGSVGAVFSDVEKNLLQIAPGLRR
jgi:hypothetical protein